MDGNKDEAQRCINIALDAAKSGNFLLIFYHLTILFICITYYNIGNLERAEKFLRKANALYPSQRAKGKYSMQNVTKVISFM